MKESRILHYLRHLYRCMYHLHSLFYSVNQKAIDNKPITIILWTFSYFIRVFLTATAVLVSFVKSAALWPVTRCQLWRLWPIIVESGPTEALYAVRKCFQAVIHAHDRSRRSYRLQGVNIITEHRQSYTKSLWKMIFARGLTISVFGKWSSRHCFNVRLSVWSIIIS